MFVVIESIDGGGKGAQRELLAKRLAGLLGKSLDTEEFPVHNQFYEQIIHPALQEQHTLSKQSWLLSFLLDKTMQSERINPFVANVNNLFIADGYFTTTLVYQGLIQSIMSVEQLIELATLFELPKPDLTIFLDVDPAIAMQRKQTEEGHDEGLDMFEKSLDKQKMIRECFLKLAQENVYCNWEIVNGNGTLEEVYNSVTKTLNDAKIVKFS